MDLPWTLTMPLPQALPQLQFTEASSTPEPLLSATSRPHTPLRPTLVPPSTKPSRATDIRRTRLNRNTLHSPRLATGTKGSLRLPLPGHMVRMPVPLSMGQTTKPLGVMPRRRDRLTGCHKTCRMRQPLPQGLTLLPQQVRLCMGPRPTRTATNRRLGTPPPKPSRPMPSTAAAPQQVPHSGQATQPPRIPSMMLTRVLRCSPQPPPPPPPRPRWQVVVRRRPAGNATRSREKESRESETTGITGLAAQNQNAKTGIAIAIANLSTSRRT
jgi:hypothetical protein